MRRLLSALLLSVVPATAGAQRGPAGDAPPFCPLTDSVGVLFTFFDVGQGDAALVESPGGRRMLVDGGPSAQVMARALRARGVTQLELVVASHNHLDHIGGLPMVLRSIRVLNVMDNGMPATTGVYRRFLDAWEASGARRLEPTARTVGLDSVAVRVLPPARDASSQNNASIGLIVSLGTFRALFPGDAESAALEAWLATDSVPAVVLLKASHHGSANGLTARWADATRPTVVVIPVGAGNSYGHPSPSVVRRWEQTARMVLRTDRDGTVSVRGCRDGSFTTATARAVRAPQR
jgi:competence protein ComEC